MEIPETFYQILEKAAEVDVKLMMPNGCVPDINDGNWKESAELLEPKMELFPENRVFQYVVSHGREGEKPSYDSCVLPYSGFAVFRSGWEAMDTWGLFDGAPFGTGHQHEDKLSFLMYAGGKLLLTEGGNYAYDTSEMRKYVLSTRAHNTIRVDGMDQNRRKEYAWKEEEIQKKANLKTHLSKEVDYAESSYEEGYGETLDRDTVHNRSVYFVKKMEGTVPFFIIVDRMYGQKERNYELLWHMNEDWAKIEKGKVVGKDLTIVSAEKEPDLDLIIGKENPEWQGFVATASIQGCYKPVPTVKQIVRGSKRRIVTVLYPASGWYCPIEKVEAFGETEAMDIKIAMKDGTVQMVNELHMRG